MGTWHLPPAHLPGGVSAGPLLLAALFFLQYSPHALPPTVHSLSKVEAGARVLNALNPLVHPRAGLEGAIQIATASACFQLPTAELPSTCRLLQTTLEGLVGK